tara:strand:+ start:911 stop:1699 length:789 start_codon:yes stop_codon:yes gene_type:complete
MDIGTGKDLEEYRIKNKNIPYHLIDILTPNEDYSVFHFQKDFIKIYDKVLKNKSLPILCGGTGLYIESILLNYKMNIVKPNYEFRKELEKENHKELIKKLKSINLNLHNTTDLSSKKRTIRAIEIASNKENSKFEEVKIQNYNYCVLGIAPDRKITRNRITIRLKNRLKEGMVEEVEELLSNGLSIDRLEYFGLEYKFIGKFLSGDLNYNDMFQKLNTAIHQFSKRQMTFFRRMEKRGIKINWINDSNYKYAKSILAKYFQE